MTNGQNESHEIQVSETTYLLAHEYDADAWKEADSTACSFEHHFHQAITKAFLEEDDRLRELELQDEQDERLYDSLPTAQDARQGFNWTPMGYHNPCCMDTPRGIVEAPLAISGGMPDGNGGGILFWAYSTREANAAFDAYRAAGYLRVSIEAVSAD